VKLLNHEINYNVNNKIESERTRRKYWKRKKENKHRKEEVKNDP
jgi:hypothetical protein